MPALSRKQQSEDSRRDNEEDNNSQKAPPSFLAAFNGDQVAISSRQQADNNALNGRFAAQLPVPENTREIAELRNLSPEKAPNFAGVSLSESVRNGMCLSPYDAEISRYALKRYHEASSFKVRQTTTFEITA